ncbi:MAG: DoxX family protein [Anaerolineaceae bacterium]|nr:DoxX family protein [Anaerolineaceae bacterium]
MAVTLKNRVIEEPGIVKDLFNNPRYAIIWLVVRVWLGWQWIEAASHKIGNPAWTETGDALKGYWTNAVVVPESGRAAISFDWYRSFIQGMLDAEAYTWFAKVVAYGELLIGIALIVGMFVGIAAFFGGFMNWNFMMAGSASTNPLLFVAAVALILAWKVAGYIGADYFLLSALGTPWGRKKVQPQAIPVLSREPAGD